MGKGTNIQNQNEGKVDNYKWVLVKAFGRNSSKLVVIDLAE